MSVFCEKLLFHSARYTGGSGGILDIVAKWSITMTNFGPLIDLNTEDFCLTVKDMTTAK